MTSNGRHGDSVPALGRFWDALNQGRPADPGGLDPALVATVRQLQARDDAPAADPAFAVRLLAELEDQMHISRSLAISMNEPLSHLPGDIGAALGQTSKEPAWTLRRSMGPMLTNFAAAFLIIVTLATAYWASGALRVGQPGGQPTTLPAIVAPGTPEASEVVIETLLDATTDDMPRGHAVIALERFRLQPGSPPLTVPAMDGVIVLTAESGELTAMQDGTETPLVAGEPFYPTNQEVALRATGLEDGVVLAAFMISAFVDADGFGTDPVVHSMDRLIETSADALPGGAGRLVVERLTLPPGSSLPPVESTPGVWTEVDKGALGLTLSGEKLPFRWDSGEERTFRQGQYLPAIQPGTQMTFGNAGDDPLVLYRLTLEAE